MNPFVLNLEGRKPEIGLIRPSSYTPGNEDTQKSEFAKILKSQIMEEPAGREEAVEKENQRNISPDETDRNEDFLENINDKLYERFVRLFHEAEKRTVLQGEKKEKLPKTEEKRTVETHETEIIRQQKELKSETSRLTENETTSKIKPNIEGPKTIADYAKKIFNELTREEKHLNESSRFLEPGSMSKEAKNAALDESKKILRTVKKDSEDTQKEFSLTKSEKDAKPFIDKLKNQKANTLDGERVKAATVVAKASQEDNEHSAPKITVDTAKMSKTEISAETKSGHSFQFSRDEQLLKTETANKISSAPQARPSYNFQEQLQSLLDNAKVYVKDGKNGSFHVNLYPKSLGSVSMNLGLEHGILNGRFLVENAEVKETLLQNFDNIKQQLEESGITVGEFHVNVRGERGKHSEELQKEVVNYKSLFSENEEIIAVYETNTTSYHKGSINMVI